MRILKLADEHRRVRENLSSLIDGALDAAESTRIENHLTTCDDCRAELESLRATVRVTRAIPEVRAPRSFALTPNDVARIRESRRPLAAARFWTVQRGLEVGAMAAAVLFVALLVGDITTRSSRSAEPLSNPQLAQSVTKSTSDGTAYVTPPTEGSATELSTGDAAPEGTATMMVTLETATAAPTASATATATASSAPTASATSAATQDATATGTPNGPSTPFATETATATSEAPTSPTADAPLDATEQVVGAPTNDEGDDLRASDATRDSSANPAPEPAPKASSNGESGWRIAEIVVATVAIMLVLLILSRRLGNQSRRPRV